MINWNEVVAVDARVERIAAAAELVVATGDENRDHPDAIYVQAKRHFSAVVGPARGRVVAPPRPGDLPDLEVSLGRISAAVRAVEPAVEAQLSSAATYQLVCTCIYDRLCRAYDKRHQRWTA